MEEVEERLRTYRGFFSSMTPEQRAALEAFDGADVLGLPSEEEAECILRNRPGFFSSMTPEQRAALEAFDGPEVLGPANGPTRTS